MMESYSVPLLRTRSATPHASAKVGISLPIWLKDITMFLGTARESWALDLSPTTITGLSESTGIGSEPSLIASPLRALRVALDTEEWIPPQRPLSEDRTIKSFLGFWAASSGGLVWDDSSTLAMPYFFASLI